VIRGETTIQRGWITAVNAGATLSPCPDRRAFEKSAAKGGTPPGVGSSRAHVTRAQSWPVSVKKTIFGAAIIRGHDT